MSLMEPRMSDGITFTFTLDEQTEMSAAYSAGAYADAYESEDLDAHDLSDMEEHERVAFVLGFFSSRTLDEIASDREVFDEAYFSTAGRYIVGVAKYAEDRSQEYADDADEAYPVCIRPGCTSPAHRDSRCLAHLPEEG